METIVLIYPHPDDEAYGMGGTALLLKEQFRLHLFCLSKGERGLGQDPSPSTAAMREQEARTAAAMLNAELEFFGAVDGEVFASRELCERVGARIKALDPRAILTTWSVDNHPDHAAACEVAIKACRQAGLYGHLEILQAEEGAGVQTMNFDPHLYVDITAVIEQKNALLRCHACQNPADSLVRDALEQSRFRGRLAGCAHAEAWRSYFPIVGGRGRPTPLLLNL